MWLAIAPVMTIGIAVASPAVEAVFQRGQFSPNDTAAVAGLLQVYLLSLAPACLGSITARGFYVLKDLKTFSVLSSIESVVYMLYTALFAHFLGAIGVALGFVLYFYISLLWTIPIIRYRTGNAGGRTVLNSFMRIGLAALFGGAIAWRVTLLITNLWFELAFGCVLGFSVYAIGLWLMQSPEFHQLLKSFRGARELRSINEIDKL
jgi:putative peptidoglycan lipid II flippase